MNGFYIEKKISWEVIDVELAHVFQCDTAEGRDAFQNAIELVGHRAIVKEVSRP